MKGGRDPLNKEKGSIQQKAIIELVCNKDMSGWEPKKDPQTNSEKLTERDEKKDSPAEALKVVSYTEENLRGDMWGVLRLDWQTKHACEDASSIPSNGSSGWGFFTWFIIMYAITFHGLTISLTCDQIVPRDFSLYHLW
jgi:hypothetical protein